MLAMPFKLRHVPDLTLSRYATLGVRGIGDALEAHPSFLRLFAHRPNTSLHLFYVYDPHRQDGERMSVFLAVMGDDHAGDVDMGDVEQIVLSSTLAHLFDLRTQRLSSGQPARPRDLARLLGPFGEDGVTPVRFSHVAALSKSAKFMRTADNPAGYYTLPAYERNDDSRLYALMKLMQNLDVPAVLRVDLYPSERASTLRETLPVADIWALQARAQLARDYALDLAERSYEDLLKSLEGSPLFHLDAAVFAQGAELARALLDAAASEAVSRGGLSVGVYEGEFDALSLLSPLPEQTVLPSLDGTHVIAARRAPGSAATLPGFVQVDAAARSFSQYDIGNLFTLEEAACLFRLPALNEGEAVQLRKETAPRPVGERDALFLGTDGFGQRAYFEMAKLNKHAFVSGVPGSGKTNVMHHMATSLVNRGVPVLVLEPAKHEYRAMLNADLAQQVRVFSPGGELAFPLRINPLQIPYGVTVGQHVSRLCTVFGASFPLTESLPFLLDRAVEAVYAAHGWRSKDRSERGDGRSWPTLSELYDQLGREIEKESYAGEVRDNLSAVLRVRLGGLLRRELGELFDVPVSTFEPNEWLRMSAIVELEALGRSEANFLTLLLLVLIRECLMVNATYEGELPVRHVIFIEEAHNLVGGEAQEVSGDDADPKRAATAFLADMLREVRAYSEGIVIADQLPTAIAPEVLKNTGLKVALRTASADDRKLLGSMMAASGVQLERLATADPGEALVLYEGLQRPFEIRMAQWLSVPGTREYVDGREARERASVSPVATELRDRLIAQDVSWYRGLRVLVPRSDAEALRARVASLDRTYALVFSALDELARDLPAALGDQGAYEELNARTDRLLHTALGTRPRRVDGSPVPPDLSGVAVAYADAWAALRERARGWADLGLGSFARLEDVSPLMLVKGDAGLVEGRAIYEYSRCDELCARRTLALYEAGAQRFATYRARGGARALDRDAAALRRRVDLIEEVCAKFARVMEGGRSS